MSARSPTPLVIQTQSRALGSHGESGLFPVPRLTKPNQARGQGGHWFPSKPPSKKAHQGQTGECPQLGDNPTKWKKAELWMLVDVVPVPCVAAKLSIPFWWLRPKVGSLAGGAAALYLELVLCRKVYVFYRPRPHHLARPGGKRVGTPSSLPPAAPVYPFKNSLLVFWISMFPNFQLRPNALDHLPTNLTLSNQPVDGTTNLNPQYRIQIVVPCLSAYWLRWR